MKITLINMTGTRNYIINYNCELWRCFKSYSFEIKVHLCLIFHQNKKKIHFQNYTNFFYRMVWCVNYYLPSLRIQKKKTVKVSNIDYTSIKLIIYKSTKSYLYMKPSLQNQQKLNIMVYESKTFLTTVFWLSNYIYYYNNTFKYYRQIYINKLL